MVTHNHAHELVPRSPVLSHMLRIGVFAAAVGVVGGLIFDLHRHTCTSCGGRWRHLGAFNFGSESAHTCARCGAVQWTKDHP